MENNEDKRNRANKENGKERVKIKRVATKNENQKNKYKNIKKKFK